MAYQVKSTLSNHIMHQYLLGRTETEVRLFNVMPITEEEVFTLNVKPFTKDFRYRAMASRRSSLGYKCKLGNRAGP